jgi:signal transduction histidine kinase
MNTSMSSRFAAGVRAVRARASAGRCVAVAAAVAVLALAGSEARHTVLVVLSTAGLFAAGAGCLLRWRVTGTRSTWQVGIGLVLLGLHVPGAVAVDALLDGRVPASATAAGLGVVAAAAAVTQRAFGDPLVRWWRRPLATPGLALAGTALLTMAVLDPAQPWAGVVHLLAYLLTGAAWLAVAVGAWRVDPLGTGDRASFRALAGVALAVGTLTAVHGLPALVAGTGPAVRTLHDTGMTAVALAATLIAGHRLTDALAGQERYVAGLLEQLAGHERQLQQTRACLHDSRAAVAGVRAASSAVRHLGPFDAARADLQESVALELARLERMLRLPERIPSVTIVDLDQVVRPLVVSHRERGLRVSWAPSDRPPVAVDADALAVILGNLLGNALAHAPRSLCRVTVGVTDRLTVTVADDGPGLPAARRAAAFEAGARRPGSPGEGLGLAISRDLARRHGGDLVAADSRVGACFVLTLPVHVPAVVPGVVQIPRPRIAPMVLR